MIRAAANGLRFRLQAARDWLATDRRWAVAAIGVLALMVLGGDSEVDLAPIVLSALLVTIGVALVRSESPAAPARSDGQVAPRPVRERRPRSKLLPLTFAVTLLVVGLALVLDATTSLRLEPGQFTALTLATIGAGLLLGGWWGRARLLIPVGLLLIPVVLVSSLVEGDLSGRIGTTYQTPALASDMPTEIDILAGGATLDLSGVRLNGQDRAVNIELGVGEIDVYLPQRFQTVVTADLRGGGMWILGRQVEGTDLHVTRVAHEELAEQGTLTLNISAGAGSIAIDQVWVRPEGPRAKRDSRANARQPRNDKQKRRNERPSRQRPNERKARR